ncbi:MAG: ABC transporter permease [Phycisphaeraceae bacterium]
MFEQLLTIARNTFTEAIRQPIFVVLVLLGLIAMVLNPAVVNYTLADDNKILTDIGLSTILLVSLFVAAFTASGVLSSEIESRTVLTVVSKPVARPIFVLGKYLGVAGAIAIAFLILSLMFVLTLRHGVIQTVRDQFDQPVWLMGSLAVLGSFALAALGNYLFRWVFTSTLTLALAVSLTVATGLVLLISPDWQVQSPLTEFTAHDGRLAQITLGLVLVLEAVMLLAGVAVAASTRLGQIMTLLVCLGVFALGLSMESLSNLVDARLNLPGGVGLGESLTAVLAAEVPMGLKMVYTLAKLVYVIAPDLQFFWPADAISQGHPMTAGHLGTVTAYAGLYLGLLLCLAVSLFQTREVG